jgi:hypothetical protein
MIVIEIRFLRKVIRPDRRGARRGMLAPADRRHDHLPPRCVEHKPAPLILDALLLTHWSDSNCHSGSVRPTFHVTVAAWTIDRFADGKIAESRLIMNGLGLMQQLGVVPPPT